MKCSLVYNGIFDPKAQVAKTLFLFIEEKNPSTISVKYATLPIFCGQPKFRQSSKEPMSCLGGFQILINKQSCFLTIQLSSYARHVWIRFKRKNTLWSASVVGRARWQDSTIFSPSPSDPQFLFEGNEKFERRFVRTSMTCGNLEKRTIGFNQFFSFYWNYPSQYK